MTWFKIDDRFHSHPKVLAAGNAAVGLWARCGSWSADQNQEGFVPHAIARMYGTAAEIKALVRVGLFEDDDRGGYLIHDWLDFNPSADRVASEREAAAERQRRLRASRRDSPRDKRRDSRVTTPVSNGVSHTTPTRPDPSSTSTDGSSSPADRRVDDAIIEHVAHLSDLGKIHTSAKGMKIAVGREHGPALAEWFATHPKASAIDGAHAVLGTPKPKTSDVDAVTGLRMSPFAS